MYTVTIWHVLRVLEFVIFICCISWIETIRKPVYFITSNIFRNENFSFRNENFLRDRFILTWIHASEISEHLLTL